MNLFRYSLLLLLSCSCLPGRADVVPPEQAAAKIRLYDNPNAYDRVDNFCKGKKNGATCSISGSTFSGGGEGICTSAVDRENASIDLSCIRKGEVDIDRKLPEGGFVNDSYLCQMGEDKQTGQKWNCKPASPTPADRFCQHQPVGGRCTVELTYQGKLERHEGICRQMTETKNFYYMGRRTATREVIRCEPPETATRVYTPASWWQKLFQ